MGDVHDTEGREVSGSGGQKGVPSVGFSHHFSSPSIDETDRRILSLTESNPMTILTVAEKMDIPFVECLRRTRKLWRMELLERTDAEPEEVGLYRYSAVERN